MGKIMAKKIKGMSWAARISLVLVFTMIFIIGGSRLDKAYAIGGVITSCGDCHAYPPADAAGGTRGTPDGAVAGSHSKHVNGYGVACIRCHGSAVSSYTYNHRQGLINMGTIINAGSWGSLGSYSKGTWFTQVNTPTLGTCNNVYCHSAGTGGTANTGETRGIAANTSPLWGTVAALTCGGCHGAGNATGQPSYTNGTPKANSHPAHPTTCSSCHSTTTTTDTTVTTPANMPNGIYDVVQKAGFTTLSYTYSTSGGTCDSVSCHGGGSGFKWGTGSQDCTTCHSNNIAKTKGVVSTIRRVVGVGTIGDFYMSTIAAYAGGTRHLYGATTIIKWDCIVCHREGSAFGGAYATGKTSSYHNDANGYIDLRNMDTVNEASGWSIRNKPWGSTGNNPAQYWTTTDYTSLDAFCLTCHDANGAAVAYVNSTNNGIGGGTSRALTPFNTTDVVAGALNGSTVMTGSPRLRVTNVKDQFYWGSFNTAGNWASLYNGNPSQHAVLGQRYSTIGQNRGWGSWTAAAWSSYVGKKMGQNVNVRRETSQLTCADCHVLDSGSGAHAGQFRYNMWASGVSNFCWRCHASGVYELDVSPSAAGSRVSHGDLDNRVNTSTAYGLSAGTNWNCLLCHASWNGTSTVTRQASYGGIHGSWSSTAWYSAAGQKTAYRFFPGTLMRVSPGASDGAWNSGSGAAATCYYWNGTAQGFDTCTKHTGSATSTTYNFNRPPKY